MKTPYLLALTLPLLILTACGGGSGDSGSDTPEVFKITTASLPNAIEGVSYTAQLSSAHGTAPVSFAWAPGFTAPAWLSLSATGELSGTPTATATIPLQVEATDSSMPALVATRTLNLTVVAQPAITTTSLPRAIKGTAYSHQLAYTTPASLNPTFALAAGSTLPNGLGLTQTGVIGGTTTDGGLFEITFELLVGTTVVDSAAFDLVVYESIPYTYIEDALEPNDSTGSATQLLPGATPAGRLTASDPAVQATPLTLNSDLNITKPDGDDYFKFNIGSVGTIKIEVFYRWLVGEVDATLWFYSGSPTHQVLPVAESATTQSDDEAIVYHNAQLSGGFTTGYYYLQVHAPADATSALWNRNAYSFRITFNHLTIATEQLEADSAGGSINEQVVAYNQGASPTAPSFSIAAGVLPSGVSFTSDGRFTGTPTQFGLYDFTVEMEDGGVSVQRDIKVRFFDSNAGDFWQIRGERREYNPGAGDPLLESFGDAMTVAPHPDYPTEGAIYVSGGFGNQMLDSVRVFHTDRTGIPAAKQFKFEDLGKPLPVPVRYHGMAFLQHSYGGYLYVIGGEIGAASGAHTSGDLWRSVLRMQVADGAGDALSQPLSGNWEVVAELPDTDLSGKAILGWAEFGVAVDDQSNDTDDRLYLLGGRYDLEDSIGAGTYSRTFHDAVLMYECPTAAAGTGTWFRKTDTAPYTARRFPAVGMIGGKIYIAAGREGTPGQTGSGSALADYIEMYQPDNYQANAAISMGAKTQFPTLTGGGGYYPMFATMNGELYIWCGWDSAFHGTKALNRFDPAGNTVTRLCDADWGTGFGGGVAHDGKLWIISGIGHGADSEPKNLVYNP
ncbi:MAG: putative Ig domain-containing protein [Planctomycetes bacterium]|nr:putative Ig domain-containing protein [Planctomycetota bacterium]